MELVSVGMVPEYGKHLENLYLFRRLLLLLETLLASFVRHCDLNPKLMTLNACPQERLFLSSTLIILTHTLIYHSVIYLLVYKIIIYFCASHLKFYSLTRKTKKKQKKSHWNKETVQYFGFFHWTLLAPLSSPNFSGGFFHNLHVFFDYLFDLMALGFIIINKMK
jgi:hypothetical protein